MSNCVEKLSHKTANCNSSDGLQVFEEVGKYTGFCFACNTYVPDPYQDKEVGYKPVKVKKSAEDVKAEMDALEAYPYRDLEPRKLERETLEYLGMKVGVSEEDGITPVALYCPYTVNSEVTGYKVQLFNPKTFFIIGTLKDANLFGWERAIAVGAKRLYITEGEKDAASLFQALKHKQRGTQYEKYNPAVVSIINGASSAARDIGRHAAEIRKHFKEVVLVFDNDAAGQQAVQETLKVFPTAIVASIPGKDPNDCLMRGHSNGLANAVLFKSEAAKNTRVVQASSLFLLAKTPAEYGLSWPWEGLTERTRGIRKGETIYIGAGVKMGKSEMVNSIGAHMIKAHGQHVLMAKPEETNVKTVKLLASKMVGSIFHDPKLAFDEEAYDRACSMIGDKLHLIDVYQSMGWKTLKDDIIDAVNQGCESIFIDPVTNLTNGIASGDANTILQGFAQELSEMSKDLNFTAFIFCHLKAPDVGPPHERGGKVFSSQFAGSRAMMRSCNLMLGLEGDKSPDLEPEQRNLRKLVILEDREFGETGTIPLFWDQHTSFFNEIKDTRNE